ncbi:hypothetical protein K502DRAFT_333045 [Neoconidiobolus thromboides FSU 785]|nr:hypothetical protein K502DRAFT_333045 [Neoconidiobolus thromboides FSU 785]
MSCVVQLTLTTNNANFKDIKHIETAQLNHLEYLNIHNLCSYKAGVLKISFDHMPNLQELILSKMSSIGFDSISNLKYLELNKTRLKNYIIDRKQFPKLVSILVKGHPCMSFRLLYSIFNLPNLTCLTLLSDSLTLPDYLLLDEIYPNKPSNLTKISINEFNISYTLIQFLQRLCKRLQHLNIADCHFDTISSLSLPLLNSKIGSFNNDYYLNQLEQAQVNNFCTFNDNDELSLNKFSESILSLAPNLRYSYYYYYLPKLKDQQAILKFHDVSHLKWYYGF